MLRETVTKDTYVCEETNRMNPSSEPGCLEALKQCIRANDLTYNKNSLGHFK